MGDWTPSMYEAARRLLRSSGGVLYVPSSCTESAKSLVLGISDEVPSMILEPEINSLDTMEEFFFETNTGIAFSISAVEPGLGTCWVKTDARDIEEIWNEFCEVTLQLAGAGYPGCIGCGGPGSDEKWDEVNARFAS